MTMNKSLQAALEGVLAGIKETPRGFFAPGIAFFRWAMGITGSVLCEASAQPEEKEPPAHAGGV